MITVLSGRKQLKSSIFILAAIILCLRLFGGSVYAGNRLTGTVSKVIDGDSFVLRSGNGLYEIRLWGIDCPEYRQPFSAGARAIAKSYLANGNVQVEVKYQDKYDRFVGVAFKGSTNINEGLIKDGAAWVYRRYCQDAICEKWKSLENDARKNRIGLWKQQSAVPPWVWRRKNN